MSAPSEPGREGGGFDDVEAAARTAVGVRLFTVLAVHVSAEGDNATLERLYTSHPVQYPVSGEKVMPTADPWPQQVVVAQQPYLGIGAQAVAAVFADHAAIAALGCSETLNLPVVHRGVTLGVLNLLAPGGTYDEASITAAEHLPAMAVAALEAWHAARGAADTTDATAGGGSAEDRSHR